MSAATRIALSVIVPALMYLTWFWFSRRIPDKYAWRFSYGKSLCQTLVGLFAHLVARPE